MPVTFARALHREQEKSAAELPADFSSLENLLATNARMFFIRAFVAKEITWHSD
jgi:hypothetical protein